MLIDILTYVGIGVAILFVVLLILAMSGKGEHLKSWLGPVGGLVVAIVAFLGLSKAGGNGDLEKIRAENERIRKEMDRLKGEYDKVNADLAQAKSEYEEKLKDLQGKLDDSEATRDQLAEQLKSTADKDPIAWLKSLPDAERKKIISEINDDITWI